MGSVDSGKRAEAALALSHALAGAADEAAIVAVLLSRIRRVVSVASAHVITFGATSSDTRFYASARDRAGRSIDASALPLRAVARATAPRVLRRAEAREALDALGVKVPRHIGPVWVVPLMHTGPARGLLIGVGKRGAAVPSKKDTRVVAAIATSVAIALDNTRTLATFEARSRAAASAKYAAEKRVETFRKYADLFAAAADGLAAISTDGVLLFGNPRAFELIGIEERNALGRNVRDVVDERERERVEQMLRAAAHGEYPVGEDIHVRGPGGIRRTVCLNGAALGDDAVLLSFRDVTEERRTADELFRTKEFLEALVAASPDAIVAADMKGKILVFNEGAARVYGYRSEDVINKMNVAKLYPGDGAREVMRMLRSPQYGGVGRVENVRTSAVSSSGEQIPIALSAAVIYERGTPTATFGIFIDLRERLSFEERLARAQEKLAVSEKQALIAELAGTAAHELNQPLTSVMVYAELLKRKLSSASAEHGYAAAIVRDAERMADIVRKIGKITRYETKSYVGGQRILDLEKSSEDPRGIANVVPASPPNKDSS